jgi:hypothetical protein
MAADDMWEVVGGKAKGGIVVREGKEMSTKELTGRLSTGALVRTLEIDGGRLHYELVEGSGPSSGWVSITFQGRDVLVKSNQEASGATAKDVLLRYSQRFGAKQAQESPGHSKSFEFRMSANGPKVQRSDNEATLQCQTSSAQTPQGKVEEMLRLLNEEESARRQKEVVSKEACRAEYGIGWKAQNIPRNADKLAKLELKPLQGMCCLVLDEDSNTVKLAPTIEPAAAVNLEYLSVALQCRSREGREPFFSLDPMENTNPCMQEKRYEPDWLAGTSVGEVMFQADYHLKELSMGQYDQPVVGMKSCLDLSQDAERDTEWNGREWFVVRKADVLMSDDNVLVPQVTMAVEARQQFVGSAGLEDALITKPNHPLVKYAEAFTKNFDLIAERKSVVFHLRELAKASILAKYLFESGLNLEDAWFNLADPSMGACALEVPQLWNERFYSQVHVQDGAIVKAEEGMNPRMHGVYGGVQFGLDRFTVGARPATLSAAVVGARGVAPRVSAALSMATSVTGGLRAPTMMRAASAMRAGVPSARAAVSMRAGGVARGVAFGLDRFTVGARPATLSATVVGARGVAPRVSAALSMATSVTGGLRAPTMMRAASAMRAGVPSARGVDLNLDEFTLTEHAYAEGYWAGTLDSAEAQAPIGAAFWSSLDAGATAFRDRDARLLKAIYNPKLSDRRDEGDCFVPPETSSVYLARLRDLITKEASVQEERVSKFLSSDFAVDDAGSLFPPSWQVPFRVADMQSAKKTRGCPAHTNEKVVFDAVLGKTGPFFDKATEEGTRFRIYRDGKLEVRTIQEVGGKETLGAIFTSCQ